VSRFGGLPVADSPEAALGALHGFGTQTGFEGQGAFGAQNVFAAQSGAFVDQNAVGDQHSFGTQDGFGAKDAFGAQFSISPLAHNDLGHQTTFGGQASFGLQNAAFGAQDGLEGAFEAQVALGGQDTRYLGIAKMLNYLENDGLKMIFFFLH
jgi:hypothetical protein